MTKRTPEMIERVRQLAAQGETAVAIGRALGVSRTSVANWAREAGVRIQKGPPPAAAVHLGERLAQGRSFRCIAREFGIGHVRLWRWAQKLGVRSIARPGRPRRLPAVLPAWVPQSLHETYLTIADRRGEEEAASEVRRLKRAVAA